jgi:hypothetical protein
VRLNSSGVPISSHPAQYRRTIKKFSLFYQVDGSRGLALWSTDETQENVGENGPQWVKLR